jgi:hypothetical protein
VPVTGSTTCTSCGRPIDPTSRFCDNCGCELIGSSPAADAGTAHAGAPRQAEEVGWGLSAGDRGAGATQTYLGYRLIYSDNGTDFNPLNSLAYYRSLKRQLFVTVLLWVLLSVVLSIATGAWTLLSGVLDFYSGVGGLGSSPVLTGLGVVSSVLWVALTTAVWLLFWFRRLTVQLTEWLITVDDAGPKAHAALEHMYAIISSRRTPLRQLRVIPLQVPGQPMRSYLRLDDGYFAGFVSSFPYGTDLFIGWTFWLSMSPAQWLVLTVRQMFRGASANIYVSLANDQPKAMREIMHAAVRQGVDMASGEIEQIGHGVLGSASVGPVVAL